MSDEFSTISMIPPLLPFIFPLYVGHFPSGPLERLFSGVAGGVPGDPGGPQGSLGVADFAKNFKCAERI